MTRHDQEGEPPAGEEERSLEELFPMVYAELRGLADRHLRLERDGHTLRPTDLVHEAYLRLSGRPGMTFRGRGPFLSLASRAMRRILVDHARRKGAAKRGGDRRRVELDDSLAVELDRPEWILALDRALEKLAEVDPDAARIAELRYFAGLTERETAVVMGMPERTMRHHWSHAKAWLRRELSES